MFINLQAYIFQGKKNLYTAKNIFRGFLGVVLAKINLNFCTQIDVKKQVDNDITRTYFRGK